MRERWPAIHRTYLAAGEQAPDPIAKAPVTKPRMMLGKPGGGAVQLAPIGADGFLGLSEGIETGLAVMTACPGLPVWAALSTRGWSRCNCPPRRGALLILAERTTTVQAPACGGRDGVAPAQGRWTARGDRVASDYG